MDAWLELKDHITRRQVWINFNQVTHFERNGGGTKVFFNQPIPGLHGYLCVVEDPDMLMARLAEAAKPAPSSQAA